MKLAFLAAGLISVLTPAVASCTGETSSANADSVASTAAAETAARCSEQLSICVAEGEKRIKKHEQELNQAKRMAIGLRSLLPVPAAAARSTPMATDLIGAWQSGYNPALADRLEAGAIPARWSLIEERIEYKSDGRVCGVDIVLDRSGGHYPFYGTWALESNDLVETFRDGRAPVSIDQSVSRRRRIVHEGGVGSRGIIRFDAAWPNRYELVLDAEGTTFRFHDHGRAIEVGGLPEWCFR